ncbi:hypothetical protein TNCV_903481 [Trichonephila clavipes]|nr:hypothetical protein TNCV_903481 [Trichonephila clavipes]
MITFGPSSHTANATLTPNNRLWGKKHETWKHTIEFGRQQRIRNLLSQSKQRKNLKAGNYRELDIPEIQVKDGKPGHGNFIQSSKKVIDADPDDKNEMNNAAPVPTSSEMRNIMKKVGKPIDENSACVEVGTTHKHLRRGANSNNFKNYFSSNDITCEVVKSVESTFLLDTSYVRATREPEKKKKETATHIGIREAEDWFRPIDLAKECDIYISSRSGSHKEIPITMDIPKTPLKIDHKTLNQRDCEKRFKPKESNDHIHNKINVNTLKIESEKQNSDECANLQYVNIFVENQPVTALIDSGCQILVLNSSLIRVQTPFEEIITLSSCFGEQRMVEVKPINISLNQHSPSLSVRTAISPTLTEEFIIHPSIYSEIEKLGHAKSDVLLSESESSLSADLGAHAYAYSSAISFPNVSFSSVMENSSYNLPHVKNFNTRNDSSSLIKDYKYSPLVSMEVPLRTAYGQNGRCSMQPNPSSLRAQAQLKHELKLLN